MCEVFARIPGVIAGIGRNSALNISGEKFLKSDIRKGRNVRMYVTKLKILMYSLILLFIDVYTSNHIIIQLFFISICR